MSRIVMEKEKIAVWGIGRCMQENLKYVETMYDVMYFIDNDEKSWNIGLIDGSRICKSPEHCRTDKIDFVLIMVLDMVAVDEIEMQLTEMGMRYKKIDEVLSDCIEEWDKLQIEQYNRGVTIGLELKNKIARYVECYITKQTCNMHCSYCFVTQHDTIGQKVIKLKHSPQFIAKSLSPERLGGRCLISICANGEPLIDREIVKLIDLLLMEGHYVYLITNGTITSSMRELERIPRDRLSHLFIRFSFHYYELKRLGLLKVFFENIKRFHKMGGSFSILLVGSEDYIEDIETIKALCISEVGALPQIDFIRDETDHQSNEFKILTKKRPADYLEIWKDFDSKYMEARGLWSGDPKKVKCWAGNKVTHLNLMTGELFRCPSGRKIDNIYTDISEDIHFLAEPECCPLSHCACAPGFNAFGLRPELNDAPTFYELMNRETDQGDNWIQTDAKDFFSSKFDYSV